MSLNPLPGSVTVLIHRAKEGDAAAADSLLARYLPALLDVARRFHIARNSTVLGGSDFAMSACAKLCCALVEGRLQRLQNRDDLWPLMIRMAQYEAKNHARAEFAQKRGQSQSVHASTVPAAVLESGTPPRRSANVCRSAARSPVDRDMSASPEMMAELYRVQAFTDLIADLPTDLREIAIFRLLGYSNAEIAIIRQCAERSVERKLRLVRCYLEK